MVRRPALPARWVRRLLRAIGLHPEDPRVPVVADGGRALVVATNHGWLDIGQPTGVFASEMTVAYYLFLDAGMEVDVASPAGGLIPVDPLSRMVVIRTPSDDRFLADPVLRAKVTDSLAVSDLDVAAYDIVYLAGGWGAAYDFGLSEPLAAVITQADAAGAIIGGVCHGPLGLINATAPDGRPLLEGRRVTGVSNRQIRELRITSTPQHPETELRGRHSRYESRRGLLDVLANHWVVDGNLVTGQNQNAAPMVAREMLVLAKQRRDSRTA